MASANSLEQSYLALFKFLMMSKRRVVELGAEYGLTGMQTTMLFMLDKPRQMNSFRKIFNCDASNITGLVDGLEHKKLAARYEKSTDRRIKMVELETEGRRVRNELVKHLTITNTPLLSKLSPDELKTFVQLLEKITKGAENV